MKLLVWLAGCLAWTATAGATEVGDFAVYGNIYTVDAARSWANAMVVKGGKILYVGSKEGAKPYCGKATREIALEPGQMVLPGLHDSHVHLLEGGLLEGTCHLFGLKTKEAVLQKIAEYGKEHPEATWILGAGWASTVFPGSNPRKEDLDQIFPDRPVWLFSDDGHSAWANSAAIKEAGIEQIKGQPAQGRIERDPATGEPSGTFREGATELVEQFAPKRGDDEWEKAVLAAQQLANSLGITSIQDALVGPRALQTYYNLAKKDALTVKIVAALGTDPAKPESQVDELVAEREKFTIGKLRPTSVKIFADGGFEGKTAALLEAYADDATDQGDLNWKPERLQGIVTRLDKAGFQIHVHVIGDKAAKVTLDAIEAAEKENGRADHRHQLAHLELISPEDIPRLRKLGVIANVQPFWCFADPWILEESEKRLGAERAKRLYPLRTLWDSGAVVAGGSDWTVSSLNPFDAIQVGMTHQPIDQPNAAPWIPSERLGLPELLAAYTINGAYANHEETTTGSLEAGKAADFIIIDRNLFDIPPQQISATKVLATYVDGREVYKAGRK